MMCEILEEVYSSQWYVLLPCSSVAVLHGKYSI